MDILDTIIAHKKVELAAKKAARTLEQLEQHPFFSRPTFSLVRSLGDSSKTGIIAEFKRRSPSKGAINEQADIREITKAYTDHGASGISILADHHFFGGSLKDLEMARMNRVPILCKEFIIDEYQVVEAKAAGADVILLIAACLTPLVVRQLTLFAKSLQLEVLLEIHREEELLHICEEVDLVGVNNRDLKTFSVDLQCSFDLSRKIPAGRIMIAESGIYQVETIRELRSFGFKGFLIGENFMKEPDPSIAFASFVHRLKNSVS